MTIDARSLLALATQQRYILESASAGLGWAAFGELAAVHVDEFGWTADGPALVRRFLGGALSEYLEKDPHRNSRVQKALYGRPTKVEALHAYWGITTHPASPAEVQQLLVDQGYEPHPNTIRNWAEEVTSDSDVLAWAAANAPIAHPLPRNLPDWPRPRWAGDRATWPASSTWPPDSRVGRNERGQLLARARRLLEAADQDGRRGFASLEDEDLLLLLRETAAARVSRHFAPEYAGRLLRHFRMRVFDRWTEHPESVQVVEASDEPVADGGALSMQVATAVQMAMHDIATGGGGELREAANNLLNRRALAPEGTTAYLRSIKQTLPAKLKGSADDRAPTLDAGPVEELYEKAALLRAMPDLAEQLAASYVAMRVVLDVNEGMSMASMLRLRLADQSASLDIARLENVDLMKALATAVQATPPNSAGMAYMTLTRRDQAILSLKRKDEGSALSLVSQAFQDLDYLAAHDMVDSRSELEARHQLYLAATGDYVRVVERVLANARSRRRAPGSDGGQARLTATAVRALTFAERTSSLLAELDSEFASGLPEKRHAENQISTSAWRVRTGIIVLRAELSTLTAVESKLIALPKKVEPMLPGIEVIAEHYRLLTELGAVAVADAPEIVTLGMWVAMLNHGRLPVSWDLASALRPLTFIDRDPQELHPSIPRTRRVDLISSTRYLAGHPLGVIGQCVIDGPVSSLFDARGGGTYSGWRASLGAAAQNLG